MKGSTWGKAAVAALAAVLVVGGSAWGVSSYRAAQVTDQATTAAQTVESSLQALDDAASAYEAAASSARQRRDDTFGPVVKLFDKHGKAFEKKARNRLSSQVKALGELLDEEPATAPALEEPFDAEDLEQRLLQEYRESDADGREDLDAEVDGIVERLEDQVAELEAATSALTSGLEEAEDGTVAVARSARDRLAGWQKSHAKASKKTRAAAKRAAEAFADLEDLSTQERSTRVGELSDSLGTFVKARSAVKASHEKKVAAERAARARAQRATRPAGPAPASGASGGQRPAASSGGGGAAPRQQTRMCSRYVGSATGVGQLMLLPC